MTNLVNTQRSHYTTRPNYADDDEVASTVTLTTRQRVHSSPHEKTTRSGPRPKVSRRYIHSKFSTAQCQLTIDTVSHDTSC